ncbi:MAG: aspartate aminotransferase family protein [Planctomycetes bacterium]|nr:aspartate aminotransferase family protein [Planctomycetota bacterium]
MDLEHILKETDGRSFDLFKEHVHPQFARVLKTIGFDRDYGRAEGPYLWDREGNRYLDFLAGWGALSLGRGHPDVRRVLRDVVDSDLPNWVAFDIPPLAGRLAEELLRRMPSELERVYFCNSGAECVEAAIKFARRATGHSRILYAHRAFHGLTCGALSVNGDQSFRDGFEPFLPGTGEVPLNDLEALERAFASGDVAGIIVEPVQGKGVYIATDEWMLAAQRLCRAHDALLICDEIQSGMGRCGRFLACEWTEGIDPDIVLLAKALSGGFVPVGAVLTRRWIYEKVYPTMSDSMAHACTFGMGNLAMAAGLATLHVMDRDGLVSRANELGARFKRGLDALKPRFPFLGQIRQRGLMIGIEFHEPDSLGLRGMWKLIHKMDQDLFPQAIVIPLLDDHRILTQVAGHHLDVVKLLPPLIISEDDVDWFLGAFEQVMVKLHKVPGPIWEVLKKLAKHALRRKRSAASG